ncbi:YqaJ viral recombinase family protein [Entomospira culicis]|uniref:YqaJ viral recombinase domain-containing protein n=1 Tax=Entomospira culicis TaxID=2719989 RepID=A0A968KZG5_9SPIO|nr:YqaJ viral recombinase family protein [Entomospira culicis]NIZ19107.1 hypothetical protein [Entomospira culicis]NIZ69321.1 hypothetical protein [Entomospira culicis]WDI37907.1 YqaJ viral recombinase family protein [Entomospira culicis]WDI39534.1 YqaJ viral recombinase family protein [Entomospira culicis]
MNNLELIKDKYGYRLNHLEHRHHADGSKKWHALRRAYIGGSDSAALANNFAHEIGISYVTTYASPLTLYRAKTQEQPVQVESEAIARGKRREGGLRAIAARTIKAELGKKVKVRRQAYTYLATLEDINLGANLDGIVIESDGSLAGLEIKTGNVWVAKEWANDGLPANYYCQVQHYMMVTGLRTFYLLAEIGDSLLLREVPYNEAFCAKLMYEYKAFQEALVYEQPPMPLGLACENTVLTQAQTSSKYIQADDLLNIVEQRNALDEQIKLLEAQKDKLDAQLKLAIGEHEGLAVGGYLISYKQSKASISFDSKKFALEHEDLYQRYCSSKVGSRRFLVKYEQSKPSITGDNKQFALENEELYQRYCQEFQFMP